jgi:hypothetical protein
LDGALLMLLWVLSLLRVDDYFALLALLLFFVVKSGGWVGMRAMHDLLVISWGEFPRIST